MNGKQSRKSQCIQKLHTENWDKNLPQIENKDLTMTISRSQLSGKQLQTSRYMDLGIWNHFGRDKFLIL